MPDAGVWPDVDFVPAENIGPEAAGGVVTMRRPRVHALPFFEAEAADPPCRHCPFPEAKAAAITVTAPSPDPSRPHAVCPCSHPDPPPPKAVGALHAVD